MRLTPRGEEVREVVATLESDDFDTPEDMAKALIKQVADLLWFRTWYVLGVRRGEGAAFGPFSSEAEAKTYGKKYEGALIPPDDWGVVPVYGMGQVATNEAGGRPGGGYGYCATDGCGCPAYAHAQEGTSRGKCVVCGVCPKFAQAETKKKASKARKVTA
ncbi:hypothetical protein [Plantactinospora sp. WMMB782]|uniref:hypothetical protein n=1 Tax=Plantactinospora sp. WMMB782 TaxID=3404121 RepID=UPI003B92A07E